jgi:glycosyltransferase involved in cell wall biosynthesis
LAPKVSVVVETVNALHYGPHLLIKTLDSIYRQCPPDCEILVIDVGLSQFTLQELSKLFPQVRIVEAKGSGYFQAKNIGYENARSPIVVFPDSDCVPSTDWLAAITEPFGNGAEAVAGRSLYVGGFLARVMNITDWGYFPSTNAKFTKFFAANNFGVRKPSKFLFDERFWRTGGDITMANDMYNNGIRIYFSPSARINHYFPYRISDFVEMRFQEGFHVIETRKIDPNLRGGGLLKAWALAPLLYYFGRLALDGEAIKRHREMMGISFWEAPVLFLFAAAYRMLDMLAMMLTLAAPRGFRTKFDW